MRVFSAIASAAVVSAMGLVACMHTQESVTEPSASRPMSERELEAAAGLVKKAAATLPGDVFGGSNLQTQLESAKTQMRAAGVCEGMIGIVDDLVHLLQNVSANPEQEPNLGSYPHISRMIACVPALSDTADDGELVSGLADFQSFNSCICGGSGSIFGNFDALARAEWAGFQPAAVTDGGFAPSSATSNGFTPSSSSGFQPSNPNDGFTPSTP